MPETWQNRFRSILFKDNATCRPCICIQGGGAKGAWEAGVLAALIDDPSTSSPIALFGTSAGAMNALWASTSPNGTVRDILQKSWLSLGRRICICSLISAVLLFGIISGVYTWINLKGFLILLSLLICGISLVIVFGKMGCINRVPGIFPISVVARLLPSFRNQAKYYTYVCTADVNNSNLPCTWDKNNLGTFVVKPGEHEASILDPSEGSPNHKYPFYIAAMASAALPILCRPYKIGEKLFLDGGLEANLPAEFIYTQGTLGGACVICIIPRPLNRLNPKNHVDYRTIRFLQDIKNNQERYRSIERDQSKAYIRPAHTMYPIFVIAPERDLTSGLMTGFFLPGLLKKEFIKGEDRGRCFQKLLHQFIKGDDNVLNSFLLDSQSFSEISEHPPRPGFWALWANTMWRKKGKLNV